MFVLLVRLSFSVLHEIDQVLKGRIKWYEKSAKRKVNYKGSFETGSSKVELLRFPVWKFLNTLWIWNRVNAKSGYFSGDVRRFNPVLCREYCIQDGNLCSKVFSRALNSTLTRRYDACSVASIPRGVLGTRVNPDTCGMANSIWEWIRVDVKNFELERNSCGFKNIRIRLEGAWTNDWMACHPLSLC